MQEEDDAEDVAPSTLASRRRGPDGRIIQPSPEEVEAAAKKKAIKDAAEQKLNEKKAKAREERVTMLVEKLKNQLALFTEQADGEEDEQTAAGGSFNSSLSF
jgi:flagellar biosynthesis/type III secretory pathway protein FliH